ncbi:porin family protein [Flavobacterium sp. UMI-01]|uniref:porin family protein n=1 Tax=Flavobacterium sp. UMI-01 TaxID=1441053 RepID=UPI001C7D55B5|nr:porin family protein [Flavobacterium sp. UMI-01]GIZ09451.1 hypothetical protein FUMI01_21780 [Flavobacterium sp. UMI-01]
MKKITLVVVVFFVTLFVHSQEAVFGVKGGANASLFGSKVDTKIGFQAGVFSKIKLVDNWYLQPEVLYLQQAVKRDDFSIGLATFENGAIKLSYMYVPVMVKYYPVEKWFLEVGPQLGFLLNTKASAEYAGERVEPDVHDEFEKMDFGVSGGSGYDFNDHFSVALRYYVGVSKMSSSEYVSDFYNRNSILSLSVAYSF